MLNDQVVEKNGSKYVEGKTVRKYYSFLILLVLLVACQPSAASTPTSTPTWTPQFEVVVPSEESVEILTPVETPTPLPPDARSQSLTFLERWKADDYAGMYTLLSSASQAALSLEDFTNHFRAIAIEMGLKSIEIEILAVEPGPAETRVHYRVIFHSNLVPDVQNETSMTLLLEDGQWRVKWEDTLVMSYLSGANYLSMNREDYTPQRGNIYDQSGQLLAGDTNAYAVGLNIITYAAFDPKEAKGIIGPLARLSGLGADTIQTRIDQAISNAIPFISMGEYSPDKAGAWERTLNNLGGVEWNTYAARFYYGFPMFGSAPHVIGYVGQINTQNLDAFRRQGFRKDELIGQNGLEKWGEAYLLGRRGGALYVRDGGNQILQTLAEAPLTPAQDITTTLRLDLQVGVQRSLTGLAGAAVVLERDTGRVLAIASSPVFNPNAFAPGNLNSRTELTDLNDPLQPLYNRATQGQYPLGSVFKIISMAAALESGRFNADTSYECGYFFTDVPGYKLNDWTWEHYQQDGETQPSGRLTLPQSLIRSCNPYYYHIGQDLFEAGLTKAIPDMARSFGLGSLTGIQGVAELAGQVPDPPTVVDSVYLATGQSDLQVTPLQVASFVAAVGNGGILYTPQVIERIATRDGQVVSQVFKPQERGKLPVKAENLALIQSAMRDVIISNSPRGTAYYPFRGLKVPVYGKTGTAQTGVKPHAWFAAYSDAQDPKLPDIAVAVIVENGGEGSEWAAPIARRIFELYFQGYPALLFPWESGYYTWETP